MTQTPKEAYDERQRLKRGLQSAHKSGSDLFMDLLERFVIAVERIAAK